MSLFKLRRNLSVGWQRRNALHILTDSRHFDGGLGCNDFEETTLHRCRRRLRISVVKIELPLAGFRPMVKLLTPNLAEAIKEQSKGMIRDVPPFYTKAQPRP